MILFIDLNMEKYIYLLHFQLVPHSLVVLRLHLDVSQPVGNLSVFVIRIQCSMVDGKLDSLQEERYTQEGDMLGVRGAMRHEKVRNSVETVLIPKCVTGKDEMPEHDKQGDCMMDKKDCGRKGKNMMAMGEMMGGMMGELKSKTI